MHACLGQGKAIAAIPHTMRMQEGLASHPVLPNEDEVAVLCRHGHAETLLLFVEQQLQVGPVPWYDG